MSSVFLIFPNTLFEKQLLPQKDSVHVLLEEPLYFGDSERILNFNKIKLVLHRASLKYYEAYLHENSIKTEYFEYSELKKNNFNFLQKKEIEQVFCFDPIDHLLAKRLTDICKKFDKKLTFYESPNFLTSTLELADYKTKKTEKSRYFHHHFYAWQKKRLNILVNSKSYDTDNRNKIPDDLTLPEIPKNDHDNAFIVEAQNYVLKNFPDNYGSVDSFIWPITHATAKKWVDHFIKHKLKHFGDYQDAIDPENPFLFHSLLSAVLNIGLINPDYIVQKVSDYYHNHRQEISINNYEGFVRQLIGWREYERFLYLYAYDEITSSNYFENKNKLSKDWYYGTTGLDPLDTAIKTVINYGYLHHIQRLMIIANAMNLCQINPHEAYRWFMELFIDAYDWVMIGNVYSMGLYADGGLTMRKPYVSSDLYIMNMSSYKKGEWNKKWKNLYHYFLLRNAKKLQKTLIARNLSIVNTKSTQEKLALKKEAEILIKKITKQ